MVHIIGGGLAGSEAAWQAASLGVPVVLHEMRPVRPTAVHKTDRLAELVCSNSFRGDKLDNAVGLLKEEMRRLGSLVMRAADAQPRAGRRGAGRRSRAVFARDHRRDSRRIRSSRVVREEVPRVPADPAMFPLVIATGPLTSDTLSADIARWSAAITSISTTRSARSCWPSRSTGRRCSARRGGDGVCADGRARAAWQHSDARGVDLAVRRRRSCAVDDGEGDYLNCPMTRDEYERFYEALVAAESATVHDFDKEKFFEGCLPIEVMAHRGRGHAALRPDEAGRPRRSAHRAHAVRRRAAAAGQHRRRSLQPGRLPDADQVGRAGARAEDDPGARAGRVRPLRHGPPQHLHQRADGAARDVADEVARRPVLRRPDLGRRRLRGIGGVGPDRRPQRRRAGPRRGAARAAAHDGDRRAGLLRVARRPADTISRPTSRSASWRRRPSAEGTAAWARRTARRRPPSGRWSISTNGSGPRAAGSRQAFDVDPAPRHAAAARCRRA